MKRQEAGNDHKRIDNITDQVKENSRVIVSQTVKVLTEVIGHFGDTRRLLVIVLCQSVSDAVQVLLGLLVEEVVGPVEGQIQD